jgi:hypothetical protein
LPRAAPSHEALRFACPDSTPAAHLRTSAPYRSTSAPSKFRLSSEHEIRLDEALSLRPHRRSPFITTTSTKPFHYDHKGLHPLTSESQGNHQHPHIPRTTSVQRESRPGPGPLGLHHRHHQPGRDACLTAGSGLAHRIGPRSRPDPDRACPRVTKTPMNITSLTHPAEPRRRHTRPCAGPASAPQGAQPQPPRPIRRAATVSQPQPDGRLHAQSPREGTCCSRRTAGKRCENLPVGQRRGGSASVRWRDQATTESRSHGPPRPGARQPTRVRTRRRQQRPPHPSGPPRRPPHMRMSLVGPAAGRPTRDGTSLAKPAGASLSVRVRPRRLSPISTAASCTSSCSSLESGRASPAPAPAPARERGSACSAWGAGLLRTTGAA